MYNLYIILEKSPSYRHKIGFTKKEVKARLKQFKTGNSNDLEIIYEFRSKHATKIEKVLHEDYKNKRGNGEWFNLSEDDIICIKEKILKLHKNFSLLEDNNTYIQEKNNFL